MAAAKKEMYVNLYGRPGAAAGWHFLTGEEASIRRLTSAVGFHYSFDPGSGQFAHATARRDYVALCDEVLAPTLIQRLTNAGVSCHQAMKLFVQSVENPTLIVSRISVRGHSASATVRASATGQPEAQESIELVQTRHGWRLTSLASPR